LAYYIPVNLLTLPIVAVQSTCPDALDCLSRSLSSPGTEILAFVVFFQNYLEEFLLQYDDYCHHEYPLAFSCRSLPLVLSRLPCQVVQFGLHLKENILYPVSHRQYVFSIPIILRTYFKYDRKLLGKFSQCINQSLLQFFRKATRLKKGTLVAVMAIQAFGK
jgi:hypothetical protein